MANIYKVTQEQYNQLELGNSIILNGKTYEYEEDAIYIIADLELPEYSLSYQPKDAILNLNEKSNDGTTIVSTIDLSRAHNAYYADQAGGTEYLLGEYTADGYRDFRGALSAIHNHDSSETVFRVNDVHTSSSADNPDLYFPITFDFSDNQSNSPTILLGTDFGISIGNKEIWAEDYEGYFSQLSENGEYLEDKYAAKEYVNKLEQDIKAIEENLDSKVKVMRFI